MDGSELSRNMVLPPALEMKSRRNAMHHEKILEEAKDREITKEEALYLFKETNSAERFLSLLRVAGHVRDQNLGKQFKVWVHVPSTTEGCITSPPCRYCWNSSRIRSLKSRNKSASPEELIEIAKMAEKIGFEGVQPGGGCTGKKGKDAVEDTRIIKKSTNLKVYVNYGYDMSEESILQLKNLGVERIGCQLEAINPQIFYKIKPGDNLEKRKEIMQTIEKHGVGLDSGIMIGVGESYQDRVDGVFYLKRFRSLKRTSVCGFLPIAGTPMQNEIPATTRDIAVTLAIMRLVHRDIDIEGSFGRDEQLQIWIMAGTNIRLIHGLFRPKENGNGFKRDSFKGETVKVTERFQFINLLPFYLRMVREAGLEVNLKGSSDLNIRI